MKKSISILLSIICITGLVGCGSKKNETLTTTHSSQPSAQSQDTTKNSSENTIKKDSAEVSSVQVTQSQGSGNVQDKKATTSKTNTITDTSSPKNVASNSNNGTNSFEKYFKLIGMSKEKLISTLNEQPVSVDEGGLEFKKNGIRVWFDYDNGTTVNQMYIEKNDVNYNGVKIGDAISSFKKVFGKPEREDTSSAYCNFKYNGMFLNVGYDPKTQKTISVYIMKNDFK